MKNLMKRVSASVLACITIMATTTGAYAMENNSIINDKKTGSITIHKYDLTAAEEKGWKPYSGDGERDLKAEKALENYKIEGVEFSYVKVADIIQDRNTPNEVGLKYNVDPTLAQALELDEGIADKHEYEGQPCWTSTDINKALKKRLEEAADTEVGENEKGTKGVDIRNVLENYITKDGNKFALTDANGVTSKNTLPIGLYLIVETKVPANVHTTVDPFFVSIPMTDQKGSEWFYDLHVYPKNQTDFPNLQKKVRQHDDVYYGKPEYMDTATVSTADTADYIFVSHLPKITSKDTFLKEYTYVDKMEHGATYNKNVSIRFYNDKANAEADNSKGLVKEWTGKDGKFIETYDTEHKRQRMTVRMTQKGLDEINKNYSRMYMVVSYSAHIEPDFRCTTGDSGMDNDVRLTWRRTSMEYPDYLEDRTRIFSYGFDLTKKFTEGQKNKMPKFTDVEFVIKNMTDGHYLTAHKENGNYYITDDKKAKSDEKINVNNTELPGKSGEATHFIPDENGKIIIYGLEADEYEIKEVETAEDYQLLRKPLKIKIVETKYNILPTLTTHYDTEAMAERDEAGRNNVIDLLTRHASATMDDQEVTMLSYESSDDISENAIVPITIINTPDFLTPVTGDRGIIILVTLGCISSIAGIILTTKSKVNNK